MVMAGNIDADKVAKELSEQAALVESLVSKGRKTEKLIKEKAARHRKKSAQEARDKFLVEFRRGYDLYKKLSRPVAAFNVNAERIVIGAKEYSLTELEIQPGLQGFLCGVAFAAIESAPAEVDRSDKVAATKESNAVSALQLLDLVFESCMYDLSRTVLNALESVLTNVDSEKILKAGAALLHRLKKRS